MSISSLIHCVFYDNNDVTESPKGGINVYVPADLNSEDSARESEDIASDTSEIGVKVQPDVVCSELCMTHSQ